MEKISRIISAVFTPLMMPTYGMIIVLTMSILYYVPTSTKWWVICTTLALTAVVPMLAIYLLLRLGKISEAGLNKREERTLPYIVAIACYAGEVVFLHTVHSPGWLMMFVVGGIAALTLTTLINLKWKISAHAAGVGGLLGLAFYILSHGLNVWPMSWLVMTLVIVSGVVCTTRLILERHTLTQLGAGFALGFCCVMIATILI